MVGNGVTARTVIPSSLQPGMMRSQVKWGLFLIAIGILLIPIGFPILLLYAVPLIAIGIAIIVFRKREEQIETRNVNP
jgi:uncharacterized membrane protein